jgi:predicted site-specific integrase-resolvase
MTTLPAPRDGPSLMTTAQAARALGVSRRVLCDWVKRGCFVKPLRYSKRKHFFRTRDVEKFLGERPAVTA